MVEAGAPKKQPVGLSRGISPRMEIVRLGPFFNRGHKQEVRSRDAKLVM